MIAIDIGIDNKIHHEKIKLKWYLLALFLIKVSYLPLFYIVNSQILLLMVYITLVSFLSSFAMKINRHSADAIYGITYILVTEIILYLVTIIYYYAVTRMPIKRDGAEIFLITLYAIPSLINIISIYAQSHPILIKKRQKKIVVYLIILMLFCSYINLYCFSIVYNEIKNDTEINIYI